MVQIDLGPVGSGSSGVAPRTGALRDGARVTLRVTQDLGGGRAVLESTGANPFRVEAELPFAFGRGSLIEAAVRSSADGVLLEVLGETGGAGPAASAGGGHGGARAADAGELLAGLGLADTGANRAAAAALVAEGEAVTAQLVLDVASALEQSGDLGAARARAVVRLIAAGIPPGPGLVEAAAGGDGAEALAEALAALGDLASADASFGPVADRVSGVIPRLGNAAALDAYVDGAAGTLLEALGAVESQAAESLGASGRLAGLDGLIEILSARAEAAPAGVAATTVAAPGLETLIAPDGSLAAGAEQAVAALGSGAAAALLEAALEAERRELSRAPVSAALGRAARALRGALSRAVLPRAAALAGWGEGALAFELPVGEGEERVLLRLRIREGGGRKGEGGAPGRTLRVAVALTMSVLGPVLAELRLRGRELSGVMRLSTDETVRLIQSHIDELHERLAEAGFAAAVSVERFEDDAPEEGGPGGGGRGVSPDIRKVDLTI